MYNRNNNDDSSLCSETSLSSTTSFCSNISCNNKKPISHKISNDSIKQYTNSEVEELINCIKQNIKTKKTNKFILFKNKNEVVQFKESQFIDFITFHYLLTREQAMEICVQLFQNGMIKYVNPLDIQTKSVRNNNYKNQPQSKKIADKTNKKIKQNVKKHESKE
eukprot:Pgem_evm1s18985